MPKSRPKPAYQLHAATGQARVRINGKDHYLGRYGSPEAKERYDELIAEWLTHQDTGRVTLTIDDLALLFLEHATAYYRHKDGSPTSELGCMRNALCPLIATHGRCRVRDFDALKLKRVRQTMIDAGLCRTNINWQMLTAVENGGAGGVLRRLKMAAHMSAVL